MKAEEDAERAVEAFQCSGVHKARKLTQDEQDDASFRLYQTGVDKMLSLDATRDAAVDSELMAWRRPAVELDQGGIDEACARLTVKAIE